jgi:1-pyrroline-5-carboxylate dehydrogenase
MLKGFFNVPAPVNEPIKDYAPGSKERELLKAALADARSKQIDIPMHIAGKEVHTDKKGKHHPSTRSPTYFGINTVSARKLM